MKKFKESMSMHVNMESYLKAKADFYENLLSQVEEELISIHHASWITTHPDAEEEDTMFVHEQLTKLLEEDWEPSSDSIFDL